MVEPSKKPNKGLIYNKFYVDEIYDMLLVRPLLSLSTAINKFDIGVVDKFIMKSSHLVLLIGEKLTILQNGSVRFYLFIKLIGTALISLYLMKLLHEGSI
jgi:NADH-quinone oxidoreductase subunit L